MKSRKTILRILLAVVLLALIVLIYVSAVRRAKAAGISGQEHEAETVTVSMPPVENTGSAQGELPALGMPEVTESPAPTATPTPAPSPTPTPTSSPSPEVIPPESGGDTPPSGTSGGRYELPKV